MTEDGTRMTDPDSPSTLWDEEWSTFLANPEADCIIRLQGGRLGYRDGN
jgi:hypothetical protein